MAERALLLLGDEPDNINLFTTSSEDLAGPGTYPDGEPMQPSSARIPRAQEVRQRLSDYLDNTGVQEEGLDLFDDPDVEERIPSSVLRAAFVAQLAHIGGDDAVDHFLHSDDFTIIEYGEPTNSNFIGESVRDVTRRKILVNSRYEREDFRLLIGFMTHETLHDDLIVGGDEEAINHALQYWIHMQVLARSPEIALENTELTRRHNEFVLGLLLSREPGAASINLVAPEGSGIVPGSPTFDFTDFWSAFDNHRSSPPAKILPDVLQDILAEGTDIPDDIRYDEDLAEFIDANLDLARVGLDKATLVRLAVLLQLITADEIAAELQWEKEEVIESFELKEVLDLIG